jgi:tetratricopeptide (TPR) repeat protein
MMRLPALLLSFLPVFLLAACAGMPLPRDPAPSAPQEKRFFLCVVAAIAKDGKPDAALAFIDAYLKNSPGDEEALAMKGEALIAAGQPADAQRILAALPPNAATERGLGRVAGQGGHWAEAARHFAAALAASPADPALLNDYGYALLQMGDKAGALKALASAWQLRPGEHVIRNNYLLAGQKAGKALDPVWKSVPEGERAALREWLGTGTRTQTLLDAQNRNEGAAPLLSPAEAEKAQKAFLDGLGQPAATGGTP